ncbi:MAG: hypothetical protein R2710_27080 [Acidimicrobiales bacterium]
MALLRLSGDGSPDPAFLSAFTVEHSLVGHPLLQSHAIAALAGRLPAGSIEVGGDQGAVIAGLDYERRLLTDDAEQAVLDLAHQHRSLYFYDIETDAEMAPLVAELIEAGRLLLGVDRDDMVSEEGYLFIAGETAVTSAHVDHECNFLLVTEGHKRVWLAPVGDPEGEIALEALHSGRYGTCNAKPSDMRPYDLGPGDGIFIPPRSAHYVENGPGPCTALSVVFLHRQTRDEVPVYAWNARLRRLGLSPTVPGESPWRDRLKRDSFNTAHAVWARRPKALARG